MAPAQTIGRSSDPDPHREAAFVQQSRVPHSFCARLPCLTGSVQWLGRALRGRYVPRMCGRIRLSVGMLIQIGLQFLAPVAVLDRIQKARSSSSAAAAEDGADEVGNGVVMGEPADHIGAPLDLAFRHSIGLVECSLGRWVRRKLI
jgi:hypothetical protein